MLVTLPALALVALPVGGHIISASPNATRAGIAAVARAADPSASAQAILADSAVDLVPAAATSAAASLTASPPISATDADQAFDSFNKAFYAVSSARGHYRKATGTTTQAVFWQQAEMLELAEDAYQRSGKAIYKTMVTQLYAGFVWMHGTAWTRDPYNDDVMWMVLAALRMQTITGKTAYRDQARRQFDAVYARAKTNDFGGGLWWSTGRTAKNACINAPAAIAAAELYSTLHNRAYLAKARSLYGWVRAHLFDQTTGAVYDHLSWQTTATGKVAVVDRATYTYNQGSFIGAADRLFRLTGDVTYYRDAVKALDYAQDNLTNQGILRSESSGGDGGGFKGIFARWAVKFTRDRGIKRYEPWFQQNARAALAARSAANLMDQDWSRPTGARRLYSFDTSSAVALLQALAPGPANRSFVP